MTGTEAERQFYLAAAGIRMWYARQPLPGAAPSADFDFSEAAVAVSEAEGAPTPPTAPTGRSRAQIAKLQSLMEKEAAPTPVRAAPQALEPTKRSGLPGTEKEAGLSDASQSEVADVANDAIISAGEQPAVIPRLTLQTWIGKRFMLIAALSEESSLALQQTLAENILCSIGESRVEACDIIRWPLFNNAGISLNAPSHLVDVLTGQVSAGAGKAVIMLGEGSEWLEAALGKPPRLNFPANLASLAGAPNLKRELWQLLKPLQSDR